MGNSISKHDAFPSALIFAFGPRRDLKMSSKWVTEEKYEGLWGVPNDPAAVWEGPEEASKTCTLLLLWLAIERPGWRYKKQLLIQDAHPDDLYSKPEPKYWAFLAD
jgi:hypothetical protein